MKRVTISALVLSATLAAACSGSSSSSSNPGGTNVSVTNFGVSAREFFGEGDLVVANVSEIDEGVDLNGDGDMLDLVAHLIDLSTGVVQNTGLAPRPAQGPAPSDVVPPAQPQVNGSVAVFVVSEASQGATDLNGDGDANDSVLHVYDPATGTADNLGYAVSVFGNAGLSVSEDSVAFAVTEFGQGGLDMDGDGLSTGSILHILDLETSIVIGIISTLGTTEVFIEGDHVAYLEREGLLGGDLNHDGDIDDPAVMQVYDLRSGSFTNTELATFGALGLFAGGAWLLPVRESDQGERDLNGDGDTDDVVLHTYDPVAGISRNLGIASNNSPFGFRASADHMAVPILESQMSADLNGDGDLLDHVPHLIDPATGVVTNTEIAASFFGPIAFMQDWLVLAAWESADGDTDFNGDGDALDIVPHVVDLATGAATNLGVESVFFYTSERFLVMQRTEIDANQDLNGDGDMEDVVLFYWDGRTGALRNTGMATGGLMSLLGNTALMILPEAFEEEDVNGDGDMNDTLTVALDLASGRLSNTGLSTNFGRLLGEELALLLVSEERQGEDLNGDGDTLDSVLFQVELFQQ